MLGHARIICFLKSVTAFSPERQLTSITPSWILMKDDMKQFLSLIFNAVFLFLCLLHKILTGNLHHRKIYWVNRLIGLEILSFFKVLLLNYIILLKQFSLHDIIHFIVMGTLRKYEMWLQWSVTCHLLFLGPY